MKKLYRRSISGLLALLICFTAILGSGMTAYAAAFTGETADSYSVAFPRDGDANLDYSGTWGHDELHYMNGWTSGEATWMTTLHTIGSFDGPACYCIEPGVPRNLYRSYESYGEDYWDSFPAEYNRTIDGRTMKTLLGRIMQYGYQGNLSLDWRSQNDSDADKLAHMMATQVLVWETVVGERDADFNHIAPDNADAVKSVYRTSHPLYSRFSAYYDSIEASVKKHTVVPSFMDRSEEAAQTVELSWDGGRYTATLTDANGVLGEYAFSSAQSDMSFAVDGNDLTISAETAPADGVTITAVRNNIRQGVVVWSDGHYGPDGTMQDVVTFRDTVSDPMYAYLHLKVSYGSVKIVKTSEDGEVSGISFTVSGNGTEQTVTTNADGEMQLDDLRPGVYTVTEQSNDRYEPQEVRQVTVISGQVATVTFHNTLKRGSLEVVKTAEDGLNEGVKFHLTGTSLAGLPVDEYAVTDSSGKAVFSDVLIGTGYILSEVDTDIRYVVPEDQTTAVEWNTVTQAEVRNVLKKWSATVTKRDAETGLPQGDATLAGAVYGVFKGEELVDTYITDESGQFTTTDYVCGDDWTIRELSPSEGYLLDNTVYPVGAEPQHYTAEYNPIALNIAQLKALFEKQWESVLGNCDELLYLGGNEQGSHKYISELLGKATIDTNTYGKSSGRNGNYSTNYQITGRELMTPDEVRMLDNRKALLFIRGELPVCDDKYDILTHPLVSRTPDGGGLPYAHGGTEQAVASIRVDGWWCGPDEEIPAADLSERKFELLSSEELEAIFMEEHYDEAS